MYAGNNDPDYLIYSPSLITAFLVRLQNRYMWLHVVSTNSKSFHNSRSAGSQKSLDGQRRHWSITKTRLFKYYPPKNENFQITFYPPKNENFQIKNSDIFLISAQNMDYVYSLEPPRRGGSNEYPQSMLLSRNKKNNVYPCKPQFYYIKVGFKGIEII